MPLMVSNLFHLRLMKNKSVLHEGKLQQDARMISTLVFFSMFMSCRNFVYLVECMLIKKIVAILQDLNVIYNCISTTERTIIEIENELLVTTHIHCVYFLIHGNDFPRGHIGSIHEIRKLRNLATCGANDPYVT